MADQKRPDERATRRPRQEPDHTQPQATGGEVFESENRGTPERETDRLFGPGTEGWSGGQGNADLRQTAAGSFARLTHAADDLSEQARQVYGSSQAFVRSHPSSTLGGALAVGVLIGLLLGRD